MKQIHIVPVLAGILLGISSCNWSKNNSTEVDMEKHPIVTVNGHTLYQDELDRVMPLNISGEDSIKASKEYIQRWVSELLMYDKAKENTEDMQVVEKLLEDYKRDFMTNSYRERLLRDHFSKSTSEENLRSYYDKNKDQFKLERPIIKGLYLKVPANSPQLANFQKWYKQANETGVENIEKNTLLNVVNYEYFYDKWLPLSDVLNSIPKAIQDHNQFLKTSSFLEVSDSLNVYLLNIKEYKLTGDEAPYEFVKDQLPEVYKEKNRITYLNKIEEDLYNKAVSDQKIKYYKE